MALRTQWQQRYLFGVQVTSISTVVTFTSPTVFVEVSGSPLLKVTNHPFDLDPGLIFVDQRKAFGQSTRFKGATNTGEFQVGAGIPLTSPQMDATPNILKMLLWLLLQTGSSEAVGTPFVATYIPYTTADAEVWASLIDVLSTATAGENQAMHGAIVRSLSLSGDMQSQTIQLSFELVGASHLTTYDASSDVFLDPNIAPLLFQNMSFDIGGVTANISAFDITISNNAISPTYHQATPFKHVLGDLTIEGSFTIPRDSNLSGQDDNVQMTDYKALTDKLIEIYWGANPAASDQDVAFGFNALLNSPPSKVSDTELGWNVSFINADDGTNDFAASVADDIDRTIP